MNYSIVSDRGTDTVTVRIAANQILRSFGEVVTPRERIIEFRKAVVAEMNKFSNASLFIDEFEVKLKVSGELSAGGKSLAKEG